MHQLTQARNGPPAGSRGYSAPLSFVPAPTAFRHSRTPGDGASISVTGELDLATAGALESDLEQAMMSCTGEVSLELAECTFMDALTLRVLLNQAAELDAHGRRLTVSGYSGQVADLFRATGMDRSDLLDFFPPLLADEQLVSFGEYRIDCVRPSPVQDPRG